MVARDSSLGIRMLICAMLMLPALASARQAPAASALVQWMLLEIVGPYAAVALEIDGQRVQLERDRIQRTTDFYRSVERTTLNTDRPHTIAVYVAEIGVPLTLLYTVERFQPAPGFTGQVLLTKSGIAAQLPDLLVPAGQSVLRAVNVGQSAPVRLFFGNVAVPFGEHKTAMVRPQTAVLELRGGVGGDIERNLRVQPGFRYDLVVLNDATRGYAYSDVLVLPVSPQFAARPTATRMFPETGHLLEGRFQEYWDTTGGLPVFGYPLNDDHLARTPEGPFVTQVFERNRFEYHPENRAPYDVLLGRLGDESLRLQGRDWRKEYARQPTAAGCDAITTDGRVFAICEPFREYYRTHGLELDGKPGVSPAEALALWGLPLTQARPETNSSGDRVLTQYFERARFEYHPNNPPDQQVLLGRLGAEVHDLRPYTYDDEDRNFIRLSPAGRDWREVEGGFGGHYWWTCAEDIDYLALWTGGLPGPRTTEGFAIEVFIPDQHANSRQALYEVSGGDDQGPVPLKLLNQKPYSNQWVRIGEDTQVYSFSIGSGTGESGNCIYQLAVDAIRFVPRGAPVVNVQGIAGQ